jgi:hypothetical protein
VFLALSEWQPQEQVLLVHWLASLTLLHLAVHLLAAPDPHAAVHQPPPPAVAAVAAEVGVWSPQSAGLLGRHMTPAAAAAAAAAVAAAADPQQ